jgi:D-tyrosyl-tRNA(Tyr) deacylase
MARPRFHCFFDFWLAVPIRTPIFTSWSNWWSGMRAVIQRVSEASVAINGQVRGAIQKGLVVLLAVEEADTLEDSEWLSGKIAQLRIFNDAEGVMNLSVQDVQGDILLVSQFTLFASTKKGNRPSYSRAARPEIAVPLYEAFTRKLSADLGKPVQTGTFGADMKVALVNDGPVTINMDSKNRE